MSKKEEVMNESNEDATPEADGFNIATSPAVAAEERRVHAALMSLGADIATHVGSYVGMVGSASNAGFPDAQAVQMLRFLASKLEKLRGDFGAGVANATAVSDLAELQDKSDAN